MPGFAGTRNMRDWHCYAGKYEGPAMPGLRRNLPVVPLLANPDLLLADEGHAAGDL